MNKVPVFEWFLEYGDVLITVNTHTKGVDIPPSLRDQEFVDFVLGPTPSPKMTTDQKGIRAPMRFSGALYHCYFPWDSVIQMSANEAVIQFREFKIEPETTAKKRPQEQKKNKTHLRVVK